MKTIFSIFFIVFFLACELESSTANSLVSPQNIVKEKVALDTSLHCHYSWKTDYDVANKLCNRIQTPQGYRRIEVAKNSFQDWLRNIPLKTGKPKVKLYNGNLKVNQSAQYAVLDIDVGNKDLQQCADAVMRLRAEYLFATKQQKEIAFRFTSGDNCAFEKWAAGYRPKINGNKVQFVQSASKDASYKSFKKYMQTIFTYCGTYSLEKELKTVNDIQNIQAGDVFIMGGFPGHAVTIMDVAIHPKTKEKMFLIAQSYMPAQDIHILKNPTNKNISPWFSIHFTENLITPEWTFKKSNLKRF